MTPNTSPPVEILHIHGGMTFKTHEDYVEYLRTRPVSLGGSEKWIWALAKSLGDTARVTRPRMPLQDNAVYDDWAICFGRYIELIGGSPFILIGNSLGGIFLARYLSENELKHKALAVYLVCPPYDGSLSDEDLCGGFELLPESLELMKRNTKNLTMYFSEDDPVVPVAHAELYRAKLPDANIRILKDKNGHFQVAEFPELLQAIRADIALEHFRLP